MSSDNERTLYVDSDLSFWIVVLYGLLSHYAELIANTFAVILLLLVFPILANCVYTFYKFELTSKNWMAYLYLAYSTCFVGLLMFAHFVPKLHLQSIGLAQAFGLVILILCSTYRNSFYVNSRKGREVNLIAPYAAYLLIGVTEMVRYVAL